jgi:hypothetical protein
MKNGRKYQVSKYPCICGHGKWEHAHEKFPKECKQFKDPDDSCYYSLRSGQEKGLLCSCLKFKADNLKYLEMKLKERKHGYTVA